METYKFFINDKILPQEYEDRTEAGSKKSAARIFAARLPQSLRELNLMEYIFGEDEDPYNACGKIHNGGDLDNCLECGIIRFNL